MTTPTPPSRNVRPAGFPETAAEVDGALTALRNCLRVTLDRLLPHENSACSLGRFLQVGRMTAWRSWTIAYVADPAQALRAMPGSRGWSDVLRCLAVRGATEAEVAAVRDAVDRFNELVRVRKLGREEFDALTAGAPGSEAERTQIVAARRSASRGSAAMYGVHAKLLLACFLVAPGRQPGSIDLANVGIIDGLRRLRPGAPWPIVQHAVATDQDETLRRHRPLGDGGTMPGIIRSLSSDGIVGQELAEHTDASGVTEIRLGDVRPEHRSGIRVVIADSMIGNHLGEADVEPIDIHATFLHPADLGVIELLVHRDLPRHTDPVALLLGTPIVPQVLPQARLASRLPLEATLRPCTAGVASPKARAVVAAYGEALSRACAALGCSVGAFDAFRIELPYPPAFATASTSVEIRNQWWRRDANDGGNSAE